MLSHSERDHNQLVRKSGRIVALFLIFAAVVVFLNARTDHSKSLGLSTSSAETGTDSNRRVNVEMDHENWIGKEEQPTSDKVNHMTQPEQLDIERDNHVHPDPVFVCVEKLDDLVAAFASHDQKGHLENEVGAAHIPEPAQVQRFDESKSKKVKIPRDFDWTQNRKAFGTKSHVYVVYDDNTVVSMAIQGCQVDGVYEPSENGEIDPKIKNDAGLGAGEDFVTQDCAVRCNLIGHPPYVTGHYYQSTPFLACAGNYNNEGYRGGYNFPGSDTCVVEHGGHERTTPYFHVNWGFAKCYCVGSNPLQVVDSYGISCDNVCDSVGRKAFVTGRWKGHGPVFFFCAANYGHQGWRGGFQLANPSGEGPCVVGSNLGLGCYCFH